MLIFRTLIADWHVNWSGYVRPVSNVKALAEESYSEGILLGYNVVLYINYIVCVCITNTHVRVYKETCIHAHITCVFSHVCGSEN